MNELTRRTVLTGLASFAAKPALADATWPNRPITLVHGFPAGGPVDIVARILAEALSKQLGQRVVVDAKPGASGTTAAGYVARAAPDGYTLMAVPATYTGTAAMYRKLPYRPLEDFSWIGTTVEYPYVLVTHAEHPIRSLADVIKRARSEGAPLQYGTAGVGTLQHLAMELFARVANLKLQHVPYRGGAPAITDLLGKRLDLLLDPPTALVSHIANGTFRALAVTGRDRFFSLPDVPTMTEAGFPGFAVTAFQGIAAPASLPESIVRKLSRDIAVVLADPSVVEQLRKVGNNPRLSSPDGFRALLSEDIDRWTKLVADASIERI
jgi:tripartite-type tricarboxylate transporter receptor subunit TctC